MIILLKKIFSLAISIFFCYIYIGNITLHKLNFLDMRQLTAQEKIKVGRMIQAYNSHRNLTTIPVVLFYYYREDDSIVNEY